MVIVEMTKEDVEVFKLFQEHHDLFIMLKARGALNIQHGKVTLNFTNGQVSHVVKEEVVFHRQP